MQVDVSRVECATSVNRETLPVAMLFESCADFLAFVKADDGTILYQELRKAEGNDVERNRDLLEATTKFLNHGQPSFWERLFDYSRKLRAEYAWLRHDEVVPFFKPMSDAATTLAKELPAVFFVGECPDSFRPLYCVAGWSTEPQTRGFQPGAAAKGLSESLTATRIGPTLSDGTAQSAEQGPQISEILHAGRLFRLNSTLATSWISEPNASVGFLSAAGLPPHLIGRGVNQKHALSELQRRVHAELSVVEMGDPTTPYHQRLREFWKPRVYIASAGDFDTLLTSVSQSDISTALQLTRDHFGHLANDPTADVVWEISTDPEELGAYVNFRVKVKPDLVDREFVGRIDARGWFEKIRRHFPDSSGLFHYHMC